MNKSIRAIFGGDFRQFAMIWSEWLFSDFG